MPDFTAHPPRDEATIASLGTKCAGYPRKDQLPRARNQRRSIPIFARAAIASSLAAALGGCFFSARIVPTSLPYRVVATHPHATDMFTEGLAWVDGELYESAGRYGHSSICRADAASGEARACVALDNRYFAEGIAAVGADIFQLTWREGAGFIYDRALRRTGAFQYDGEGWGLAYDGTHLLMSDGSSTLRVFDPDGFRELGRIPVRDAGRPVPYINELEFARGRIWANIWHSNGIAVIDGARGAVVAWLDLSELRSRIERSAYWNDSENVLNGIAYDPRSDHFYVTGKRWPLIFELEVGPAP